MAINRIFRVAAILVWVVPLALLATMIQYVTPPPPSVLVMATGVPGSPYHYLTLQYAEVLSRNGVKLNVRTSGGSMDSLSLLADPVQEVEAAVIQGGLGASQLAAKLVSLGRVGYEPVWIFYSGQNRIDRISDLKAKKILVGPAGGGTNEVAVRILAASGVSQDNATWINAPLSDYADMLARGDADAGILITSHRARTVQRLIATPRLRLMNFANAEGLVQHFPFLSRLVLREGAVDLAANIPSSDITLVATETAVVARQDLHPQLIRLLAQAVQEIHDTPSSRDANAIPTLQEPPNLLAIDPEYSTSPEAQRVYRTGPPVLERYVGFWLASLFDRIGLSLLIGLPILLPLVALLRQLPRWCLRRRLAHWYDMLRRVELNAGTQGRDLRYARLEELEKDIKEFPMTEEFADMVYELRQRVDDVRSKSGGSSRTTEPSADC